MEFAISVKTGSSSNNSKLHATQVLFDQFTNYLNLQTPYYTIIYYIILLHNVNLCRIGYITNSFNTSLRQRCYIIQNGQLVSKEIDFHTRPNSKTDATFRWSVFKKLPKRKKKNLIKWKQTEQPTLPENLVN